MAKSLVLDRSIGAFVARQASVEPDAPYLYFEDRVLTWGELDEAVTRAARGLYDLGVRPGDRVATLMRNRPEYLFGWLGIVRLGAIYVPIIADNRPAEVDHVLNDCRVKALITTPDLLAPLTDVRGRCPSLEQIVLSGVPSGPDGHGFEELLASADLSVPGREPDLQDIAQIAYTSGTTSQPKGVVHTHYPYVRTGPEMARVLEYSSDDCLFIVLPLFHGAAQITSILPSLAARATAALMPRFSATQFWSQVERYRPTEVGLLHGLQSMLLAQPEVPAERTHRIRFVWGTTTQSIEQRFRERFGIPTLTLYSLTECTFVTSARPGQPYRPEWAGTPTMADMEVEIRDRDETARRLELGEIGVIAIRNPCVMQGYYENPEETARAFRDGWLITGDLGTLDEDGNLYFKGRHKHVIRRAGENIAGEEVEAAVTGHPAVLECGAIAVPDDIREEEVKVFVVLAPGASLSAEEIVDWCEERLASFKVPRYVEFRDALPTTGSGKVQRFELAREPNQDDCWDRLRVGYKLEWRADWKVGKVID